MKTFFLLLSASVLTLSATAQEPKASPPASTSETIASGAKITINYGQPSVKGRTIGKDLEPMDGKIWRTGANEATTFEVDKGVKVEGKTLNAGKYSLFTIAGSNEWTIVLNNTWKQWGAYNYKEGDDALRVNVKPKKTKEFSEKLNFKINKNGLVSILWGDHQVDFKVE